MSPLDILILLVLLLILWVAQCWCFDKFLLLVEWLSDGSTNPLRHAKFDEDIQPIQGYNPGHKATSGVTHE